MTLLRKALLIAVAALVTAWPGSSPLAAELKAGTVITAQNFDKIKNDTFEGYKIADMMTERMEYMIKNWGMTLKLRHSSEVPIDPRLKEASLKNKERVKFNPKTRMPEGWQAGWPFPEIDARDPWAGMKVVWNHFYGAPVGNSQMYPNFAFLFIDGNKGLERVQVWTWQQYYMKGRVGGSPVEGDGTIFKKGLLYAKYPRDIAGLGTFTIQYDNPKYEDNWAYLKSVRRVRRLPGGSWMDPIGGTDMLNDDQEIFHAHPTWYKEYKYLGKKTILAVAHATWPAWDESKKGTINEWPTVNLKEKPFWNPMGGGEYEPREVHVVECVPPQEHPYSKKVIYFDTKHPRPYISEVYDRKGQFWKFLDYHQKPYRADDGAPTTITPSGFNIDVQRRHATVFILHNTVKCVNKSHPNDVSLGQLEAFGK